MAIDIALLGFNDLGRSVTPTFLFRNRLYLQLSPHYPKMNKKSTWEVTKIQDFCPHDAESCHLAATRRVKLWSVNANLFFKEPHQLTKFAQQVHIHHIWQRAIPFKALIAYILGLAATVAFFANEAPFTQIQVFSRTLQNGLSKTRSVTLPIFFIFLTLPTHHLSLVKFSEKNQCQKIFARTSLNLRGFWNLSVYSLFSVKEESSL